MHVILQQPWLITACQLLNLSVWKGLWTIIRIDSHCICCTVMHPGIMVLNYCLSDSVFEVINLWYKNSWLHGPSEVPVYSVLGFWDMKGHTTLVYYSISLPCTYCKEGLESFKLRLNYIRASEFQLDCDLEFVISIMYEESEPCRVGHPPEKCCSGITSIAQKI